MRQQTLHKIQFKLLESEMSAMYKIDCVQSDENGYSWIHLHEIINTYLIEIIKDLYSQGDF